MQKEAGVLLSLVVIGLLLIASPNEGKDPKSYPLVGALADVPPMLRTPNWAPYGSGSCMHASTITLLRWQGQTELADWWRATYSSGEFLWRLIQRMEDAGLRYSYTADGSVEFLEWATRNRLGAGIAYFPRHAINLIELNSREAILLDNNRPSEYIKVPREEFIRNWKGYGGLAWTVVYDPPPPYPAW